MKSSLRTIIVPIRKINNSIEVFLNNSSSILKCFVVEIDAEQLIDATIEELEVSKDTRFLSVLINESAHIFKAVALSTEYTFVNKSQNIFSVYFVAQLDSDTIVDNGQWVSLDKLLTLNKEDRYAIEKLNLASRDLTFFSTDTESEKINSPIIAFDCGGILFQWNDERLFKNLGDVFSCSQDKFAEVFLGDWCRYALHLGEKSHSEIFKHLESKTCKSSFKDYINAYFSSERIIDENIETLKRLRIKYKDVKFILTSNLNSITERFILEDNNIKQYFDRGFFSWRIKDIKPKKSFYNKVSNILRTKNIFLIDDSTENISAAANEGWHSYLNETNTVLPFEELDKEISTWLKNIR